MRIIVSERLYRAVKIGAQAGLVGAAIGFARVLAATGRLPGWEWLLFLPLVPAMSFALFFSIIFLLAYGFPPSSDNLWDNVTFPGARRVIWPVMAVLTAATVYLVIHKR